MMKKLHHFTKGCVNAKVKGVMGKGIKYRGEYIFRKEGKKK